MEKTHWLEAGVKAARTPDNTPCLVNLSIGRILLGLQAESPFDNQRSSSGFWSDSETHQLYWDTAETNQLNLLLRSCKKWLVMQDAGIPIFFNFGMKGCWQLRLLKECHNIFWNDLMSLNSAQFFKQICLPFSPAVCWKVSWRVQGQIPLLSACKMNSIFK